MQLRIIQAIVIAIVSAAMLVLSGPTMAQPDQPKNRVIVMGMIHSGHVKSENYSLDLLRSTIEKIKPDVVLCEIPPDRIEAANKQFKETGKITESRVRVFPEYVDVLYPLTKKMDFQMAACAGWTKEMADTRRKKMSELKTTHAQQYQQMNEAQEQLSQSIIEFSAAEDDPRFIHTKKYDALVKKGLEPYDKYFNDELGPGGWTNINRSHYKLIDQNLDRLSGQDKTILIMFGSWHKYWINEQLSKRDDIEQINLNQYLPPTEATEVAK